MSENRIYNLNWRRPDSVTYPTVWRRFERKDPRNPEVFRKFRVQDVTDDIFPSLVHLMQTELILDEPLCRATKISDDAISFKEFTQLYYDFYEQRISPVCLEEGPDGEPLKLNDVPVVAGYNMLGVVSVKDNQSSVKVKGRALNVILNMMSYVSKDFNLFEKYNVDAYITAMGLSVSSNYRGMGIATEILKAREDIACAVGLQIISTVFTAGVSQILAERVGYETLFERSYEEIQKERPDLAFPGIATKNIKYMIKRAIP